MGASTRRLFTIGCAVFATASDVANADATAIYRTYDASGVPTFSDTRSGPADQVIRVNATPPGDVERVFAIVAQQLLVADALAQSRRQREQYRLAERRLQLERMRVIADMQTANPRIIEPEIRIYRAYWWPRSRSRHGYGSQRPNRKRHAERLAERRAGHPLKPGYQPAKATHPLQRRSLSGTGLRGTTGQMLRRP